MKSVKMFLLSVLVYIGCASQSTVTQAEVDQQREQASATDVIRFSDSHINFKKWNRTNECCTTHGKKIAISSGGTQSSKCGMEIYNESGSLIDSAIAVAFCLAVERPHSAGLGGGGFLTFYSAKEKKSYFVDFRETAPAKASRDMYLDKDRNVIAKLSLDGGLSVATPGFVQGLYEAHQKWGKLDWKKLLIPAIRLAQNGFKVYPSLAERIVSRKEALLKDAFLARLFLPDGAALRVGDLLVQKELGKTLQLLAQKPTHSFYEGEIAKDIAKTVSDRGGILSLEDLKKYKTSGVKYREPLKGEFQGVQIVTAPPPSAGGFIMLQTLGVLSDLHVSDTLAYSDYIHLLAEAMKRGFADRSLYIGDPDFYKDRTYLDLLKPKYIAAQSASIQKDKATPSKDVKPAEFYKPEHRETTQLSLMDSDGNAVSSTITINYLFGSGVAVPGRGFILNDEMDDFSVKTGEKNVYGLTGSVANQVEANKRPVSSMAPTIVFKDGKPVMALGAPGGSHIVSGITETVLNYLVLYPRDLHKAVFAPRVHHQWIPDKLFLETAGFPEVTLQKLKGMDYTIENPSFVALVMAVSLNPQNGNFDAVFDPRDEGGVEAE